MAVLGKAAMDNLLAVVLDKVVEDIQAAVPSKVVGDRHLVAVEELVGTVDRVSRLVVPSRVAGEHTQVVDLSKAVGHIEVAAEELDPMAGRMVVKQVSNLMAVHTIEVVDHTIGVAVNTTVVVAIQTIVEAENTIVGVVVVRITEEGINLVSHIIAGVPVASITSMVRAAIKLRQLAVV